MYDIIIELISHVDEESLYAFFEAYQKETILKIGELWTVPIMLRLALIEVVSDMAKSNIPLSSSFVSEFCQRLASQNSALEIARSWLEQRLSEEGTSIEELMYDESQKQAADQLSVSHSINSLRFLNTTDWKVFIESISIVDQILQADPAKVYGLMNFASRDHYRHTIESLAQKSFFSETEIAEQAIRIG